MEDYIELFMVSGFLGSGKTTFLKNMLTQMEGKRVGVIVNEFGSVGIDGKVLHSGDLKMVEINNGSIFCACLKGGFLRTLVAFLSQPVDYLFVEASGMADPSSMQNFMDEMEPVLLRKEIRRRYRYRGFVCVADAVNLPDYCELFVAAQNQIRKSRLVLLNKTDMVTEEELEEAKNMILGINPQAYIYPTSFGKISVADLDSHMSPDVDEGETTNRCDNRMPSYVVTFLKPVKKEQVEEFCVRMAEYAYRVKGFFPTEEGVGRADCVGKDVVIHCDGEMMPESRFPRNQIVIIARDHPGLKEIIEKIWDGCFEEPIVIEEG